MQRNLQMGRAIFAFATVSLLAACTPAQKGAARIIAQVRGAKLTSANVSRISIEVTEAGITPIDAALAGDGQGNWTGTVTNIPAGSATFTADAYDANNHVIFHGATTQLVTGGQIAQVAIILQNTVTPPPTEQVPYISALFASSTSTPRDHAIHLQAEVTYTGPDTLTEVWSGSGTFDSAGTLETNWLPPANDSASPYTLCFTVHDQHSNSDGDCFNIGVTAPPNGSAAITVSFDTAPLITSIHGSQGSIYTGQTFTLSATATSTEVSQGSLVWDWESSNCQAVGSTSGPVVTFTSAAFNPSPPVCIFSLSVSDGVGGVGTATIAIPWAPPISIVLEPQVTPLQSALADFVNSAIVIGGTVAGAANPDTLQWNYSVTGGALDPNTGCSGVNGTCSQINWRPGPCASPPPSATLDVVDPSNGSHTTLKFTANTCAPQGCQDAVNQQAFGAVASGATLIDTDGPGPQAPFIVFCDQHNFGGGWAQLGAVGESAVIQTSALPINNGNGTGQLNGTPSGTINVGCPVGAPSTCTTANALVVATGTNWGFINPDAFNGLEANFTARIDIDLGNGSFQHTFIRPYDGQVPTSSGGQSSVGVLGQTSFYSSITPFFSYAAHAGLQLLDLSDVLFPTQNATWIPMPEFELPGAPALNLFFGYRNNSLAGSGTPCVDPSTGATKLCAASAGTCGNGWGGTLSQHYSVPGGFTPRTGGLRAQYYIKDANVASIPQPLN